MLQFGTQLSALSSMNSDIDETSPNGESNKVALMESMTHKRNVLNDCRYDGLIF